MLALMLVTEVRRALAAKKLVGRFTYDQFRWHSGCKQAIKMREEIEFAAALDRRLKPRKQPSGGLNVTKPKGLAGLCGERFTVQPGPRQPGSLPRAYLRSRAGSDVLPDALGRADRLGAGTVTRAKTKEFIMM